MGKPHASSADRALEQVALHAACSVAGVVRPAADVGDGDAPDEPLPGAVCTPLPGGGVRLELHLVAAVVSLPALAERVRDRVERAVARAGLADELRAIDVVFDDVDETHPPRSGRRRLRSPRAREARR